MIFLLLSSILSFASPCHYSYTIWNAEKKKSEGPFRVQKDKSELSPGEKGPFSCSVCEEDQREITLKNGLKAKVCFSLSQKIEESLNQILSSGYEIKKIVAYRASISKGELNEKGERKEFSSHAFGVAIDLNDDFNGLYENCVTFNGGCKLRKGGIYNPLHPLSLKRGSPAVEIMLKAGFKWGGEIKGRQKDFMHFSPSGY